MKNNQRTSLYAFLLMGLMACTPKVTSTLPSTTPDESVTRVEPMASPEKMVSDLPIDDRVVMGELSNGLKYYIQKNNKPEDRVELRLAVDAGSILEDDDQQGLAHFVEHMAFNGTEHFEKSELVDFLESTGTRFGADLNAYTSFDETVYMLQVRTDSAEILDKGLTVIQDWAGGVSFDHEEIDKERGVVKSEWRSRLSGDQRMQQKYFPVMYQGSQYAQRLPIGDPETLDNAPYDAVKRYYRDWYRPDLMAVIIVGDIDVADMEMEVKKRFGGLTNPDAARPRERFTVPKHPETLVSICSDEEASFTSVNLMYKHRSEKVLKMEDYRERIVHGIYNGMLGGRLREISQSPEPPFAFAYSGYGGDVGDLATYSSYAGFIPEGKGTTALEVILTENKRVLEHGYTSSEFEREKIKIIERVEKSFKEQDKTESSRLAMRYVYNYLDDNPIPSPEQTLAIYKKYLPTIQLSEVNSLAKEWITNENRVVVLTGPQKEGLVLPTEAEVMSIIDKVDGMTTEPYEDDISDEPLLAKVPTPKKVISDQLIEGVDIHELVLANGVKVKLKQTDFKNDEVLLSAYSPGGTSLYAKMDDKEYYNAQWASSVINQSGIGSFDLPQLTKKLAGKTVRVSPYIGGRYEGFSGSSSPKDLETMFQLIYLYFNDFAYREDALKSFVNQQKGIYKNLMSNPNFFFSDFTSKIKYDNHPRAGFPDVSMFDLMELDKMVAIYKDRFEDASDFTFQFVGNFDKDQIKELSETYLANLPSTNRVETYHPTGLKLVKGVKEKVVNMGKAPKSNVELFFHGDFEWNAENRYQFNSMIALLRIKMRESMREDKGGVYGVRVSGGTQKFPIEQYTISISFNAEPDKVDELIETAMKDVENAVTNGASAEDLKKVKETQRQSRIKDLKENRFWDRSIQNAYQNDGDPKNIGLEYLERMISTLSSESIKKSASQYFDKKNYIKFVMNPEEKPSN